MKSAAVMVAIMAALMFGVWVVLRDGSMVEPTALMVVDDLAAYLAEDLEMK